MQQQKQGCGNETGALQGIGKIASQQTPGEVGGEVGEKGKKTGDGQVESDPPEHGIEDVAGGQFAELPDMIEHKHTLFRLGKQEHEQQRQQEQTKVGEHW